MPKCKILVFKEIECLWTSLDTLPMPGGQRATSSKSHRPDILTPLIDLSVWIQSDFGEGERRSIACGIASGVYDDEAQSIAFWHAWPAQEVAAQNDQDAAHCWRPYRTE
jgi:hypothetical protein